jgi:hypothetical protein
MRQQRTIEEARTEDRGEGWRQHSPFSSPHPPPSSMCTSWGRQRRPQRCRKPLDGVGSKSTPHRRRSGRIREAAARAVGSAASEVGVRRRRQGGGTARAGSRRWALCASRRQTAVSSGSGTYCPETERVRGVSTGGDGVEETPLPGTGGPSHICTAISSLPRDSIRHGLEAYQ